MSTRRVPSDCPMGILLAILVSSASCVSFKSVAATGKLGVRLADAEVAVLAAPRLCTALWAAQEAEKAQCDDARQKAGEYAQGLAMLAQYGQSLQQIAETSDPDVSTNISAILSKGSDLRWMARNETRDKAVAGAAAAFVQLLTQEFRRSALKSTVEGAQPHVKGLGGLLTAHIDSQLELARTVRERIAKQIDHSPGRCSAAQDGLCLKDSFSDRVVLVQLLASVEELELKLASARRDIDAFGQAHALLAQRVEQVPSRDLDVYKEIVEKAKSVYEAAHQQENRHASR